MNRTYLMGLLCLMFSLLISDLAYGAIAKHIRVGKYHMWVIDSADEGKSVISTNGYNYYHGFKDYQFYRRGWAIGARDWKDENGDLHAVMVTVDGTEVCDELNSTMPIPDSEGVYIRRYRRYQPPYVTVDGFRVSVPFPMDEQSDEVAPDKIPGTADIMVEARINTSLGVTIHHRALAWSQTNHDDYVLYIWTFKNTGNIDSDPEIELPNQTLNDFYYLRTTRSNKHHGRPRGTNWHSNYGEYVGDSLRIAYAYSSRAPAATYDSFGNIESQSVGFLVNPEYTGEAMLHVDTSPSDNTDDPSQPQMTDTGNSEVQAFKNASSMLNPEQVILVYQVMENGFVGYYPEWEYMDDPDIYPGTHHAVRFEDIGFQFPDEPWGRGHNNSFTASGPYTLAPGDSITMIWASVVGSISPEKGWEVGRAWANGTATPPPGYTWNGGVPTDNLPPPFKMFPEFYENSENNWAKDCWVATGKDSIFQNAWAAQWAVRNNFNVPIPPPSPSVEVESLPDKINIAWGNESEAVSDFAGYRVYRASGSPYYSEEGAVVVGKWERVFECGAGTGKALTNEFDDTDATGVIRGVAYYYYVTAFDDGTHPEVSDPVGVKGVAESLESGQYLNMTTRPAHLTREPGAKLSDIRVVPNPFNITARTLQFLGEPDKIMFLDLPLECTIKIYTESGDLVKTIEHFGSGDESWGVLSEEHSASETGQIIVSGIYIAYIETPEGESTFVKFVVVR